MAGGGGMPAIAELSPNGPDWNIRVNSPGPAASAGGGSVGAGLAGGGGGTAAAAGGAGA